MFGFHRHNRDNRHHGHHGPDNHRRNRHRAMRECGPLHPWEGATEECERSIANVSVCSLCEKNCPLRAPGCGKGKRLAMQQGQKQEGGDT